MEPGTVVSDCHAEPLCRRAFMAFLIEAVHRREPFLSSVESGRFELTSLLHFYSTALPCGDGSIIPMDDEPVAKRGRYSSIVNDYKSTPAGDGDVYRTGARPVVGEDPKLPGNGYHLLGVGRTKGGRGPESWSMSCSDKMAKWSFCGWQGALISHLIPNPIRPASYIFGPCESNAPAMKRALSRVDPDQVRLIFKMHFNFVIFYLRSSLFTSSPRQLLRIHHPAYLQLGLQTRCRSCLHPQQ